MANFNLEVLKKCREQLSLTLEEVKKKVKGIEEIEKGDKKLSWSNVDKLAQIYYVPEWVFISDEIPDEYKYTQTPAFRTYSKKPVFNNSRIKKLVAKVEDYRKIILEAREDLEEAIEDFHPCLITNNAEETAKNIRNWLGLKPKEFIDFYAFKKKLEEKNIFIFMTSKYKDEFKFKSEEGSENNFRGLAIYYEKLPIIVINESDAKKSQSFTLIHELCHLLRGESSLDNDNDGIHYNSKEEKFCDAVAGIVLMPTDAIKEATQSLEELNWITIKNIAEKVFKVSHYAFIVRLNQLREISQDKYNEFNNLRKEENQKNKIKLEKNRRFSRSKAKEIVDQYGEIYTNAIITLYEEKEITLYKACNLLKIKNIPDFFKVKKKLF